MTGDVISVAAAAKELGLSRKSLIRGVGSGRIRFSERRGSGTGTRTFVSRAQLHEDLSALPTCRADGCEARAFSGEFCPSHSTNAARKAHAIVRADRLAEERDWYSVSEVARIVGKRKSAVEYAINKGELDCALVNGLRRVRKGDAVAWIQSSPTRRARRARTAAEREELRMRIIAEREQGADAAKIARCLDCDRAFVYATLDGAGLSRTRAIRGAGVVPRADREARVEEMVALYHEGLTQQQIADRLGLSKRQVGRDLGNAQIQMRPSWPPTKYPQPEERACEHCGVRFTPELPSWGDRRFCSSGCARRVRLGAYSMALETRGLLSPLEVAAQLRVGVCRVHGLLQKGQLIGERVPYDGQGRGPAWGVRPSEIERFKREYVKGEGSTDYRRLRWLDPEQALAQLRAMGVIERNAAKLGVPMDQAEAIELIRLTARGADFRRYKRGRPRRSAPSPRELRWQAMYPQVKQMREAEWERDQREFGDSVGPRPSHYSICLDIALEDWRHHREEFPDYPEDPREPGQLHPDFYGAARDLVRKGVKSLQIVRS